MDTWPIAPAGVVFSPPAIQQPKGCPDPGILSGPIGNGGDRSLARASIGIDPKAKPLVGLPNDGIKHGSAVDTAAADLEVLGRVLRPEGGVLKVAGCRH